MVFLTSIFSSLWARISAPIAWVGMIVLAVIVLLAKVFSAGKKSEQLKQAEKRIETIKKREKIDESIARSPVNARAERLRKYASDKPGRP